MYLHVLKRKTKFLSVRATLAIILLYEHRLAYEGIIMQRWMARFKSLIQVIGILGPVNCLETECQEVRETRKHPASETRDHRHDEYTLQVEKPPPTTRDEGNKRDCSF